MSNINTEPADWKDDVKVSVPDVNPTVLPEYTALPASPALSYVSGPRPDAGLTADDSASNAGGASATCGAEGKTVLKLLGKGLVAVVIPPAIVAAAGLAAAGAMVYGCGKLLEGMGRGMAIGPEMVYRSAVAGRVDGFVKRVRGRREARRVGAGDVEAQGAIAI